MAETYGGGFVYYADVYSSTQRALTTVLIEPLRCKLPKFSECFWRNEELLKPKPLSLDSRIKVNIPYLVIEPSNSVKSAWVWWRTTSRTQPWWVGTFNAFSGLGSRDRDYSDGSSINPRSLSLPMDYLSIYKIFDNILPLSGTGSLDLEPAGPPGRIYGSIYAGTAKALGIEGDSYRISASTT